MIETEITISLYRKSDLDSITQEICKRKIEAPIFILEYENHYQIKLSSDYEQWELDTAIIECFPDYEFTTEIASGRKEIRIQIARYQSEFSTDGWGRQIENPLNEVKYLIKKTTKAPEKFNPKIKVLFEDSIQDYCINIVNGINKASGEKGFLLVNHFKERVEEDVAAEIFKDKLYKSPIDAFHYGFFKLQEIVNKDFQDYQELKKKKLREEQKIPRKIIRDFITSCNSYDIDGIIKNLAENFMYERRVNWQTELKTEGIKEFIEFIKSANQDLCSKNFKIRSQWNFSPYSITIGVKFFPTLTDKATNNFLKYKQLCFVLKSNKIDSLIEEK